MSKTVEKTILERRSIRRYERLPIPSDDMQYIYNAIRNTPTSYNGQQYTVIDIDDQPLKELIYEITGEKQIKTCNHFLVFCADYNKISVIARDKGISDIPFVRTVDGYTVGIIDATLALMNALTAAESRGLGTCCVGYMRTAAPDRLSELLQLPRGVTIVCGLAIGIPREHPDIKPKQPESLLIHHNTYRNDDLLPELKAYDTIVTEYNSTRAGSRTGNDWASHITDYYREGEHYNMARALRNRGFLTDPK